MCDRMLVLINHNASSAEQGHGTSPWCTKGDKRHLETLLIPLAMIHVTFQTSDVDELHKNYRLFHCLKGLDRH
jgi:hypothetical protein